MKRATQRLIDPERGTEKVNSYSLSRFVLLIYGLVTAIPLTAQLACAQNLTFEDIKKLPHLRQTIELRTAAIPRSLVTCAYLKETGPIR